MAAGGLSEITERAAAAAARAGRDPGEVTVVAVSKIASDEQVLALHAEGHRDFGENRAAELAERAPRLPGDIRWHFIGRLQGNKVRRVRPVTHLLHSMDRPDLVGYWAKGPGPPPPALLQVNVAGEDRKAGVPPEEAAAVLERAAGLGMEVRGLMTIAPLAADAEEARPVFRALAGLREHLAERWPGLTELSMGMTDDFEVAVEEGATLLRVGRAIFDPFQDG
jgi:pyridoxal phosphate enzyme (YggS family)